MRVVLVAPFPVDTEHIQGGLEAVTFNLIQGLTHLSDLDLHVLTCSKCIAEDRDFSYQGAKVHYLACPAYLPWSVAMLLVGRRKLRDWIKRLAPDVVHVQGVGRDAFNVLGMHPRLVITVHAVWRGGEAELVRGTVMDFMRRNAMLLRENQILSKARFLIASSPYVTASVENRIHGQLFSVENPIKQHFFELPGSSEPNRILFVGLVQPRKGLLVLLQAMTAISQQIPTVKLRVVGPPIDQDYYRNCQAYVADHQLQPYVDFLGGIPEDQLYEEYSRCALLVLPSLAETAPMVISQAMAACKPSIGTGVGGIPHLIEDGVTGFVVNAGDAGELAERVTRLLKSPELRQRMGKQAGLKAIERFRVDHIASSHFQIYQDIINADVLQ